MHVLFLRNFKNHRDSKNFVIRFVTHLLPRNMRWVEKKWTRPCGLGTLTYIIALLGTQLSIPNLYTWGSPSNTLIGSPLFYGYLSSACIFSEHYAGSSLAKIRAMEQGVSFMATLCYSKKPFSGIADIRNDLFCFRKSFTMIPLSVLRISTASLKILPMKVFLRLISTFEETKTYSI